MTDREKLAEIVEMAAHRCLPSNTEDFHLNMFVRDLLANGVVVQRWIPVTERLPKPHELVLCVWKRPVGSAGGYYGFARYQYGDVWYVSNEGMPEVTHWMPLPEPPKEGE